MDFLTRPAEAADADSIADLNCVVQQLHYEQRPDWFKPPNAAGFLPVVQAWLSSESTAVFVAQDGGGDLLGYSIGVQHQRPDNALIHGAFFVELDQVVVIPTARNLGVGRSLCTAVLDWADSIAVDRVELSTWTFNDNAHGLFERLGFAPTVIRMSRATDSQE